MHSSYLRYMNRIKQSFLYIPTPQDIHIKGIILPIEAILSLSAEASNSDGSVVHLKPCLASWDRSTCFIAAAALVPSSSVAERHLPAARSPNAT